MLTLSVTNIRASYSTGTFKLSGFNIITTNIVDMSTGLIYRYHVFNGGYIMNFECNIGTHCFNVVELL